MRHKSLGLLGNSYIMVLWLHIVSIKIVGMRTCITCLETERVHVWHTRLWRHSMHMRWQILRYEEVADDDATEPACRRTPSWPHTYTMGSVHTGMQLLQNLLSRLHAMTLRILIVM